MYIYAMNVSQRYIHNGYKSKILLKQEARSEVTTIQVSQISLAQCWEESVKVSRTVIMESQIWRSMNWKTLGKLHAVGEL